MPIYSFYIFDRHCECIYVKQWHAADRPSSPDMLAQGATGADPAKRSSTGFGDKVDAAARRADGRLSVQDDAKLIFGVVFSLRNMVRKLSGPDDAFISYRTGTYKLHYYETPTNLKFVMLTDVKMNNLRVVLHQIYVNLYVEYVTKNPLSPIEHKGGEGVAVEMFDRGLDTFIVGTERNEALFP